MTTPPSDPVVAGTTAVPPGGSGRWLAIALVAVVQTAVLLWMVVGHARHLASGREIVLDVMPVDPRDLFLGDYVVLATQVSFLPKEVFAALPAPGQRGVFVVLEPLPGPLTGWRAKLAQPTKPTGVAADEVLLRGQLLEVATDTRPARVRYGIESYFVPEGKGRPIETGIGDKRVSLAVAVAPDGRAAIKALRIDGQPVYADPLW